MRVIFVNRFFHPDLAPTGLHAADVAFDLAASGREVHAVTSRLAYDGSGPGYAAQETVRGARLVNWLQDVFPVKIGVRARFPRVA